MQTSKTFVNFSQAFATTSKPISEFFSEAGLGFYIPLYQREYSWDINNIDQLMDDLCEGTDMLLDSGDAILFMGTVILLTESNPNVNIDPRDTRALPTRIDNVIDGQQRISTFALLATLLYMRLRRAGNELKSEATKQALTADIALELQHVQDDIDSQLNTLSEIFSLDLKRGSPKKKPVIIRGSEDYWQLDGAVDDSYKSDVAKHLAYTIRSIEEDTVFNLPNETSLVKRNLKRMDERLKQVHQSHIDQTDDFHTAAYILDKLPQEAIWSYDKPELTSLIRDASTPYPKLRDKVSAVVQLLTFANFMLKRCCFTVIKPINQNWAFDMFQSLNATGTPLTSMETFKPMVSNQVGLTGTYRGSKSEAYFNEVDAFFGSAKTANEKNRYTNDFLTAFALVQDGTKLPSQFSRQRQYLEKQYGDCKTASDKEEFVYRMANFAQFRINVTQLNIDVNARIDLTDGASNIERELAVLCLYYLRRSNHKMADTVLSRYYAAIIRADDIHKPQAKSDFLGICKVLTAFYTLWRSAFSNSGLDDVYRKLMKEKLCWAQSASGVSQTVVKSSLLDALKARNIGDKTSWMQRATTELRYGNGIDLLCRFALLVTSHNTIPDPANPGLMVTGQSGVQDYLRLEKWLADDLSSIEHIAPQNPSARTLWDTNLYTNDGYQQIGNLTLLPIEINISAGNRGWKEKYLYYKYLVVQNPSIDRPNILNEAAQNSITLKPDIIQRLQNSNHHAHIKPIAEVGMNGKWDQDLVEARTERTCDILWDRLIVWLT